MMTTTAKARLYVEVDLAAGEAVSLAAGQTHYLGNVLRLEPGASVLLFNGRDGEWIARIDDLGKGEGGLTCVGPTRAQGVAPDLWLVFAPIKRAPLDFLVQKAVELGVAALWPVFTEHTDVKRVNTGRMTTTAIEAAEQSARLTVPEIMAPTRLAKALEEWPDGRRLLVCAEAGEATPIDEALHAAEPDVPYAILTGPEGGFAPSELDGVRKLPFVSAVNLGPRLLRAETAALAALGCWQAVLGDWRSRPPKRD